MPVGRHPEYSASLAGVFPISVLCRTTKYYSLPHCFLSESKRQHLKVFCTSFANLKQQLVADALFFKACHFLKKQTLHWTQHMVTLYSNTCHNFEINNQLPHRFYSTATYMRSSVLTAVVVVGRV